MKILIAGGAGYIGSTIASAASRAGHQVVILDNLSTGRREYFRDFPAYVGDIADRSVIDRVFTDHEDISAVVHCAALIVVPDSVREPLRYYRENVTKTLALVEGMASHGCHRLLFSSSASIYGPAADFTVTEESPIVPNSPYARTKAVVETMLDDVSAGSALRVLSLRYFNPIGSDPELETGLQLPRPTHALGQIIAAHQAGVAFSVTGTNYPTRDGSGIRDYVHVWDLAQAHVAALENFDEVLARTGRTSVPINLGTGTGTTVWELVRAFNQVVEQPVQAVGAPARMGDVAGAYTTSDRAQDLLRWTAQRDVAVGIVDTLRWFDVRGRVLSDLQGG